MPCSYDDDVAKYGYGEAVPDAAIASDFMSLSQRSIPEEDAVAFGYNEAAETSDLLAASQRSIEEDIAKYDYEVAVPDSHFVSYPEEQRRPIRRRAGMMPTHDSSTSLRTLDTSHTSRRSSFTMSRRGSLSESRRGSLTMGRRRSSLTMMVPVEEAGPTRSLAPLIWFGLGALSCFTSGISGFSILNNAKAPIPTAPAAASSSSMGANSLFAGAFGATELTDVAETGFKFTELTEATEAAANSVSGGMMQAIEVTDSVQDMSDLASDFHDVFSSVLDHSHQIAHAPCPLSQMFVMATHVMDPLVDVLNMVCKTNISCQMAQIAVRGAVLVGLTTVGHAGLDQTIIPSILFLQAQSDFNKSKHNRQASSAGQVPTGGMSSPGLATVPAFGM